MRGMGGYGPEFPTPENFSCRILYFLYVWIVGRRKNRKRSFGKKRAAPKQKPEHFSEEETLARAEKERAGGNLRRAREGYRRLFKQNPEKFGVGYAEVTTETANLLADQGKLESARQLISHLAEAGLIRESDVAQAHRLLTLRAGTSGKSDPGAEPEDPVAAAREILALASGDPEGQPTVSGPALTRAADLMVLARAGEAAPVLEAIGHLCRRDWDALDAARRRLPRRSPFAHWMVFLRGCAAYCQSDFDEAGRCFDRLPRDSKPAEKAGVFRTLMGKTPASDPKTIREAVTLFGDAPLSKALPEIDRLWNRRKFIDAWQTAKKLLPGFPVFEVSMRGQLARFFQLSDLHLPEGDAEWWAESVLHIMEDRRFKAATVEGLIFSTVVIRCLQISGATDWDNGLENFVWPILFRSWEKEFGAVLHPEASLHRQRALHCLGGLPPAPGSHYDRRLLSQAINHYRKSIEADPAFEIAHRELVHLYEAARKKSERNRLLDRMSKQFPDSPGVLLDAGSGCIDRKSYSKALKYLERARELDPLNFEIGREHRRALREKAAWHYQKKEPSLGRATFETLLAGPCPPHTPLPESRACDYLRWSRMEKLAGLPDGKSEELRRQADLEEPLGAPAIEAFFWFERFNTGGYRAAGIPSFPKKITPTEALNLVRIWNALGEEQPHFAIESTFVQAIERSLKSFKKADRDTAAKMGGLIAGIPHSLFGQQAIGKIARRMLSFDRKDPYFLALQWTEKMPTRQQLETARKTAVERGDHDAIALLTKLGRELDRFESAPMPHPFSDPGPFSGFVDDFSGEEEDAYPFGPPPPFGPGEPEDMETAEALASIVAVLKMLPKGARLPFLIDAGIPKPVAKALLKVIEKAIRTGKPLNPGDLPPELTGILDDTDFDEPPDPAPFSFHQKTKPKKRPKPEPKPEKIDPNQQEFPF